VGLVFTSYTDLVYLQNVFERYETCCTLAFATILANRSAISEEQCLQRIPDLDRQVERFLLDLEVTTHVLR